MKMGKNRFNDISKNAVGKNEDHGVEPVLNGETKLEQEKLTRRQALARIGFQAGAMALLTLSVDDLARLAAKKLEQHAGNSMMANEVAQEFKHAGVALAIEPMPTPTCDDCVEECVEDAEYECVDCSPDCQMTHMSSGTGKKQKKCLNPATNWYQCRAEGNRVLCCQDKCYECCETGGCGVRSDAAVEACQTGCAKLNGSIV